VIAAKVKNGAITTNKLDGEAVATPKLAKDSVTTSKLTDGAVNNGKLADGSVSVNKLGKGVIGQLQGKLESGTTIRGVFDTGATGEAGDVIRNGTSFQFPLQSAPTPIILQMGQTSTACPGQGTDNQAPQAAPGYLCIYVTADANLNSTTPLAVENVNRLGFGLYAKSQDPGSYYAMGLWAATAQ